jgi:N-acetylmuramoyl-L-alanine amidase
MRKQDPGEMFPWQRLHEEGIGHWVEPLPVGGGRFFQEGDSGQPVEALQTMLALYGYQVLKSTGSTIPRPLPWCGRFSAISGPHGLTALPTPRPSAHLHKLLSELAGVA